MIKDDYREETNLDVYDNSERGTYCDDYVRWLENKLQLMQTAVVGQSEQLPESEKLCRMNQNFVCNCINDSRCPNF